ncbi:MAG: VOC family protein, partial [bacterium]|nr:VOC family protein [bacterium]
NFGLQQVKGGDVPSLGIRQAFLQIGDAQIELITPLTEQGPIADFPTKQEGGMYLLSLEVDDLDAAVAELQDKGVRVNVAEGGEGKRVAFVSRQATHGVLLQLLER